jgi:hypothetical protein
MFISDPAGLSLLFLPVFSFFNHVLPPFSHGFGKGKNGGRSELKKERTKILLDSSGV